MALQTGQTLNNRYRIVRLLGQGGFGAVYRAWDSNLNHPCAVKENLEVSPDAQRQFSREASVLANLSHPNLPRVTDHFFIAGQGQYLVMDFIEGEDLGSLMEKQGRLPLTQALDWITQVLDALIYLQSLNPPVVHRDIKPSNIRLTPEGRVMLVDFGLVKIYAPNRKTTMGARAVTPGYAPPEQYGTGNTDARSDIYALGATLYALLTGQAPVESVQRAAGAFMPGAQQVNPTIPLPISQAIERAMALEPGRRFQSASEFKAALQVASAPVRPAAPFMVAPASPAVYPAPVPAQANPPTYGTLRETPPVVRSAPPVAAAPPARSSSRRALGAGAAIALGVCMLLVLGGILAGIYAQQQNRRNAQNTADAQQQATQAAALRQTATSEAQFTATAEQAVRQTAAVQQTLAAASQMTAEAEAAIQAASLATEQAMQSYQATLQAGRTLVFGPETGTIEHDVADSFIAGNGAEVNLLDFEVQALFYNPFPASQGPWDYGFIFRSEEANQQMRLVIQSNGQWELFNNTGDPDGVLVQDGSLVAFNTEADGANLVRLICTGSQGKLFVNDLFIAELDLSSRLTSGEIFIVTGIYTGNEVDGEYTPYRDFTIWSIP